MVLTISVVALVLSVEVVLVVVESRSSAPGHGRGNVGALIVRMGFGLYYTKIIIRNLQNPILIVKAPTLVGLERARTTTHKGTPVSTMLATWTWPPHPKALLVPLREPLNPKPLAAKA